MRSADSVLGYFWTGIVLKLSSGFEGQQLGNECGAAVPEHLTCLPSACCSEQGVTKLT